ncbi:hypothetical protein [Humisphaera borealis]|uniref:Uncharacterized protein n=1 Tax=Humisphaera borealis TaxID=2807512 RepID=A0A7M2WYN8_9BACT|nr:hypothetical protein [Humisphaera borealis]QOV90618.1 hypothetical protein IPV69_04445 [Humisphaera borealis]
MFASIWGAQITRVDGTPSPKDDLELAKKLIESARVAVESPGLQRLMLEKAYSYAMKDPAGTGDAMHAVMSLRKLFPTEGDTWDDRAVALQEKIWRAAPAADRLIITDVYRRMLQHAAERQVRLNNYVESQNLVRRAAEMARVLDAEAIEEVKELTRAITDRQRVDKRATDLVEAFAKGTAEAKPTTLAEAAELLGGVLPRGAEVRALPMGDDKVLTYLSGVLRQPASKTTSVQAAWMGDYFRQAADRPSTPPAKGPTPYRVALLRVSAAWYARFLAMHLELDSERLRVLLASQQVAEELSRGPRPQAFELDRYGAALLTTVDVARNRISGTWAPTGGGMTVTSPAVAALATATPALLTLPVSPGEAYEITMQFMAEGASGIGLVLPVGAGVVTISRSGTACTLSEVKTSALPLNSAMPDLARDTDRHTLYARVVVREGLAAILIAYDGVEIGRWEGKATDLTVPAGYALPDRAAVGVFAVGGKAQITDISVNVLRGQARLLPIAAPDELPLDGSRPRDAVVTQISPLSSSYYHNGVTVAFDAAVPGGPRLTITEPSQEARIVRAGFPALMSNSANLAPLRTDYNRYKQLLAMVQSAPQAYTAADAQKLHQLHRDVEVAVATDAKQRSESVLFAAMHLLGDRYRRASSNWATSIQKNTSAEEFQLIVKYGKTAVGG